MLPRSYEENADMGIFRIKSCVKYADIGLEVKKKKNLRENVVEEIIFADINI